MTLLAALVLAPFTFLTLCFAVELLVGLWPIRGPILPRADESVVVLVPAHDEEAVIGETLKSLSAVTGDRTKILVVADNCKDRTAEVARKFDVEVIERTDSTRRGKGYALDFAREHLRKARTDVVIILDADCTIDTESIEALASRCAGTGRPCQAVNLQLPDTTASPAVQLSTFAFFIKNVVRQRALQRLTGRAHLLGTGMALPWPVFDRASLATDNIVEDLKMGLELAEAGHRPLFVEEASVWSYPETEMNTLVQRGRWEGGFLDSALRAAPQVLRRSIADGDPRGLWAAINLLIPPLALLVALDLLALLLGTLLAWLAAAKTWPALTLLASLLLACALLSLAWASGGRRFVTIGGLLRIPGYILWKLPMYVGFALSGTPKDWIRTRGR